MGEAILVVDDDAMNREVMEALLVAEGYTVLLANSGKRALETARGGQPDLIILDYKMDDMSGYEVCRQLKGDGQTQHIPVMMLTAFSSTQVRAQGLEAGADDFVTRPFEVAELITRIRTLLS